MIRVTMKHVTITHGDGRTESASRPMTPAEEKELDRRMDEMDAASKGVWRAADRLFAWCRTLGGKP